MAWRLRIGLAGAALTVAALDAYAVVTLLPQMMRSVDLPIDHIEAAAPILSAFMGGYVVAMPLLGALSDARGRLPAYAAALAAFAAGSAVTALAPSLEWLIAGRGLQGLGGGALVPLSLAMAADLNQGRGRAVAVGTLSALQEGGNVLGPVYGAIIAAGLGDWRFVFWLNLPLAALILAGLWLAMRRPVVEPAVRANRGRVDWPSAILLGLGLGLVVTALYPDDPSRRPVNTNALPMGLAAAAILAAFARRQWLGGGLVTRDLLRSRALCGATVANVLAGGALMIALVDLPIVGRGVFDLDTLGSGLLLSRFLLGVPVGALAGGWLAGWAGSRAMSATGLVVAGGAFVLMSGWTVHELATAGAVASGELAACGFGFGVVIAPLTTTVLDQAGSEERGLASSLVVLSRTVGMALALPGLTAFGLARLQAIVEQRGCEVVAGDPGSLQQKLATYRECVRGALLGEYREIFLIAAGLCGLAALVAALTLPSRSRRPKREWDPPTLTQGRPPSG